MSAAAPDAQHDPVVHANAALGETMIVRPVRPGDRVLRLELHLDAVHHAPPPHIHPRAVERFTVTEGEVRIRRGRRVLTLRAGETVTIPPRVLHGYAGVPGRSARMTVELEPPGLMAEFFAAVYGLPATSRDPRTGQPRLSAVAGVLRDHLDDVGVPVLPPAFTRVLLSLLARRGTRPR
jgi:quercetin dioxygenase-like cupin family protein